MCLDLTLFMGNDQDGGMYLCRGVEAEEGRISE